MSEASEWGHLNLLILRQVRALVERSHTPGATVACRLDGDQLLVHGFGYEDLESMRHADANGRYPLYSVTKLMLAAAVVRLVEQGRLDLDGPIGPFLPHAEPQATVTVRQVLQHTGGFPDYGALRTYGRAVRRTPGQPWTDAQFYEFTMASGMAHAPGQGWLYSNIGYMLVRRAIEQVTGRALQVALDELLFAPLGLCQTGVVSSPGEFERLVSGYSRQLDDDAVPHRVNSRYHPGWVAHGLVASSVSETAALVDALMAGTLVGKESLDMMFDAVDVPATHPYISKPGYGLGLMLDLDSDLGRVAGHAGGGPGFATAAFHFPDVSGHRLTVAAFANSDVDDLATSIVFKTSRLAANALSAP